jgi:pyruvate formate lyase activating enzyme
VRFVLVPGLTDAPANVAAAADHIVAFGGAERVEVLPFHQMGRYKWRELGIRYHLENTEPPSAAAVAKAVEVFRAAGLEAD